MKTVYLFFFMMISLAHLALSNNVQVSNVRLTGQNTTSDFTLVEFGITWENSWRYTNGPANWDAAWVFIKFKVGSGGAWQHAWLNNTGHTVCGNATSQNGLLTPGSPFNAATNPVLGVFLYRSSAGAGTFSCQNVQLRWNYGVNFVPDQADVDIRVFAIEMVHVLQGNFYVGSGGTETGAFYTYPSTNNPYYIISEGAIPVGTSADYLYYSNASGNSGDQAGPVPANFPKGFNAFYAMKYEISQQGYVDFLNTLTRIQQMARVASDISGTSVTNRWVMANTQFTQYRSYINCRTTIPPQPAPVEFLADHFPNDFGVISEANNVACGYLSYSDVAAYLDWAALRLMTEFEFEKCGRGTTTSVQHEYAWGNNVYNGHTGVNNLGLENESPIDPISNAVSNANNGPLRVGIFARANSNRTLSGAGYFGCMELSTNLYERGVTIGSPAGRAYTGKHGNGLLDSGGQHDVEFWPNPATATGVFLRGGAWDASINPARLSDRSCTTCADPARANTYGGRGVRTQ